MENKQEASVVEEILSDEIIDIEEYAKNGHKPPKAKRYRIRIDKQHYIVEQSHLSGRELLILAGKQPPEKYMISQKFFGGQVKRINLDESVDFTTPGVERFMTLPLDQTEGGA